MNTENEGSEPTRGIKLGPKNLSIFFISHLNKIYCAKQHLIKMLPELKELATFSDLKHAIDETISNVEKQIARMDIIYALLNAEPSDENCNGLKGLVNDAFEAIEKEDFNIEIRDMSILFYLQNIESVEMASFQVLRIAAFKINNTQVKQLLKENHNEAKGTKTLLMLISAKYVVS
jgi:ferritin-like metal-binding protein YciE